MLVKYSKKKKKFLDKYSLTHKNRFLDARGKKEGTSGQTGNLC